MVYLLVDFRLGLFFGFNLFLNIFKFQFIFFSLINLCLFICLQSISFQLQCSNGLFLFRLNKNWPSDHKMELRWLKNIFFTSNFVKFLIQFFLFFWRNVLNELNMTLDFTSFCIQILRNSNQNLTWNYNLETRLWSWKYKSTWKHRYLPGNIIVSNIIVRNDILFPR